MKKTTVDFRKDNKKSSSKREEYIDKLTRQLKRWDDELE